jgi:hypothetical protein
MKILLFNSAKEVQTNFRNKAMLPIICFAFIQLLILSMRPVLVKKYQILPMSTTTILRHQENLM